MIVKDILLVLRQGGFFHFNGEKIKAVHPGDGYGVVLVCEPSILDLDFGLPEIAFKILKELKAKLYVFLEATHLEELEHKFKQSDELTHKLLGRGWGTGPRPFWKLEDFMLPNNKENRRLRHGTSIL